MTPRRILLLMGGLFAFGAIYAIYAHAVGWLDGLPVLEERMLVAAENVFRPPVRPTSPTSDQLKQAFGRSAPEAEPAFYPTQLAFRNGDSTLVLASGSPPSRPGSNRVTLIPFSIAIFGKPKPAHLLQPGEVNEITTFHSDKAILEFDRTIDTPADMNTAKLIRLELISDPEQAIPASDPRAGMVHVTNNQRSGDPNRFLALKSVGPVFYRDPKYAKGPDQLGPDIWTDAPIEIVDRGNVPRKPGNAAAVAPTAAEECRNSTVVSADPRRSAPAAADGDRGRPACLSRPRRLPESGAAAPQASAEVSASQKGLGWVQRREAGRIVGEGVAAPLG